MSQIIEGLLRANIEPIEVVVSPNQCRHHWLIEPPQGPTSEGNCKHCGSQRTFKNHLDGEFRNQDGDFPGAQGGFSDSGERPRRGPRPILFRKLQVRGDF